MSRNAKRACQWPAVLYLLRVDELLQSLRRSALRRHDTMADRRTLASDDGVIEPRRARCDPVGTSYRLTVWLSGNALASINVVALRQTRLVPKWVTVCGRVNHLRM